MRFRFCGDIDCPDWILAEIATLSKVTSIKLRLLTAHVAKAVCGQPITRETIAKLSADTKLDESSTKASIAAILWILENASGSNTDSHVLDSELQQLGLPKEHAASMSRIFAEHSNQIREELRKKTLKVSGDTPWQLDVKAVSLGSSKQPVIEVKLPDDVYYLKNQVFMNRQEIEENTEASGRKEVRFYMTWDQLNSMINELEIAKRHMEDLG